MKIFKIVSICILIANFTCAQNSNTIVNKSSLGYFEFSKNSEIGVSFTNETVFEFNEYVNPGVRLSFQSGRHTNNNHFAYLMYSNSISLNAYLNVITYKNHKLQCAGGISFLHVYFNNVIHTYSDLQPFRDVYDVTTIGYNKLGINWLASYSYNLSNKWFVGLEVSQLYSKYKMKISAFSITSGFIFGRDK